MGRVIILEGPDGGGKTTLAKKLVSEGFEYRHEGPPPVGTDLIAHYLRILNDSLESPNNVVHDRLWLGERIYGPVARGVDRIGPMGQVLFERLHRSKYIDQYICSPGYELAKVNYGEKIKEKDDYLKCFDNWTSVYSAYQHHVSTSSIKEFNYSKDSWESILHRPEGEIQRTLPKGTIGSSDAKYLFVGDRPNHPSIDVPFFALTGSSGYLNSAITALDLGEENLAFSNATSPKGEIHSLSTIVRRLPKLEHIFLMGNVAKQWYMDQRIKEESRHCRAHLVPHPSYLKRFRGHNPEVMADIFRKELQED